MRSTNLTNHLLIAMPGLQDPNFSRTVTYIFAHSDEEGAMGLVINRPLTIALSEILAQMEIQPGSAEIGNTTVYQGGPVHVDRGFVLHRHRPERTWDSSIVVEEQISITTSRDILQAIASGEGPDKALVALGYAGWAAGQLEQEILDNAWLNVPADQGLIFDTPIETRWEMSAAKLGIEFGKLSQFVGHA
jgi:putative transcriptional regulator